MATEDKSTASKTLSDDGVNVGPHRPRRYMGASDHVTPSKSAGTKSGVPEGFKTVAQVEKWIDGAKDRTEKRQRAQAALAGEKGKGGKGRSTLIEHAESVLADTETPDEAEVETDADEGEPDEG